LSRCSAERIVDEDIAEARDLLGEIRVVGFLALVEARVLQKNDIAVFQLRDGIFRHIADAIFRERHGLAEFFRQRRGDRFQRHLRHDLSLRAVEMRQHDHPRAFVGQFLDRRRLPLDARGIGDLAILHRHIEVRAHQHTFAFDVEVVERLEVRHIGRPLDVLTRRRGAAEVIRNSLTRHGRVCPGHPYTPSIGEIMGPRHKSLSSGRASRGPGGRG
jgi:hypothetical protein